MKKHTYMVVGLGATGYSCVRYLVSKGISVEVMDDRPAPPCLDKLKANFPDVPVHLGAFESAQFKQADMLVVSPGLSLSSPALCPHREKIIGDVELFARAMASCPDKFVIGITGSNGKTTVTTLMGEVLSAAGKKVSVCGNIGRPVLDAFLEDDADYFVVELSSFQLEMTASLKTQTAVLLNISPDHLDRHGSLQNYIQIKQRVYQNCLFPVVNADEPETWEPCQLKKAISFSLKNTEADWTLNDLPVDELPLKGWHHFQNDLAVLAMSSALNIPKTTVIKTLKSFTGLMHRCEFVRECNEVAWYNDSKGTNVGATKTALLSIGAQTKGKLVWIAGGQGKSADFGELNSAVSDYVSHALLFGEDASVIEQAVKNLVTVVRVDTLEEAVKRACEIAKPGDVVLFSPACASFDMFANFEERGKCFQKAVVALQK